MVTILVRRWRWRRFLRSSDGLLTPVTRACGKRRTALQNATSIAGLMITTEAMVADLPKKDEPGMPGGDMGGMGGMGGMGMM